MGENYGGADTVNRVLKLANGNTIAFSDKPLAGQVTGPHTSFMGEFDMDGLDSDNDLFKVENRNEDDDYMGREDCQACHKACQPCSEKHERPVRPEKDSQY